MATPKKSLLFIFITVLIDVIGIAVIIPVIPSLLKQLTGQEVAESAGIGGLLIITFAAMQLLFSPVLGELSDKYGRRPILLISLFGLSIDYLFHAYAPTIGWLFVGRILAGITGASHTVATAYIADISTKENKARNFGFIGAAFGLGFIIGPAIGGIFGAIDVRLPFIVAAGIAFVNFLFGFFFVPESLPPENRRPIEFKKMIPGVSLANIGKYAGLGGLIFALFLANIAGQSLPATWSFFTIEQFKWNEAQVGYSLSAVGFMVAIVQGGLIGWSVRKFGNKKVIVGGFLLWTIGMFLFSVAVKEWMLYAFLVPYALGGVAGPTLQSLLSNEVSEKEQGNLQGALTSMISITTIIGPLLASSLFYYFAQKDAPFYFPGAPYAAASIILFLSLIIVMTSLRKINV
ncbi:MAG: TCR/Tet family MFS transporter [Flavobacteriales bacterium]|nr:TCR/Tet family MFS transporter [Flavobacteriales bacterium]